MKPETKETIREVGRGAYAIALVTSPLWILGAGIGLGALGATALGASAVTGMIAGGAALGFVGATWGVVLFSRMGETPVSVKQAAKDVATLPFRAVKNIWTNDQNGGLKVVFSKKAEREFSRQQVARQIETQKFLEKTQVKEPEHHPTHFRSSGAGGALPATTSKEK